MLIALSIHSGEDQTDMFAIQVALYFLTQSANCSLVGDNPISAGRRAKQEML